MSFVGGSQLESTIFGRCVGVVAVSLIPFLLVPLPRSNLFLLVFQISWDKSIRLHAVLGYVFVLLACIHATSMIGSMQYSKSDLVDLSMLTYPPGYGMLALACILLASIPAFYRETHYPFFFYMHVFSIPGLILLFFHVKPFMLYYLTPFGVLLAIDWILFSLMCGPSRIYSSQLYRGKEPWALIQLPRNAWFRHTSGQFLWLFVPSISLVPHPFTILDRGSSKPTIALAIKGTGFFTRALCQALSKAKEERPRIYSTVSCGRQSLQWSKYDNVVLFAGGSGITATVGVWQHLLHEHKTGNCSPSQRVLLVWVYRTKEALSCVQPHLLEHCMQRHQDSFRMHLYSIEKNQVEESPATQYPIPVTYFEGRPLTYQYLADQCMNDTLPFSEERQCGVYVCGPTAMVDDVRSTCRRLASNAFQFHLDVGSNGW